MLHTLGEWLHPLGWTDERIRVAVRFVFILASALIAAWAGGGLVGRWLRAGVAADDQAVVRDLSRSVRRVVLLVGLYQAVRVLPLIPVVGAALSGLLFVLAVLVGAGVAVRTSRLLFRGYLERSADGSARERARREYLPAASTLTVVAAGLLSVIVIAHHFGQEVSSLVTAFGVGSLAIGLAAQQTLGNMFAGFTLLIDRPFGPGDRIRLQSGESGEVMEIGIRATRILLPEGSQLIVPNAELVTSRVVNQSYPATSARAEVKFRVGWDGDLDRITSLLLELAHEQPETVTEPSPSVALVALDGKGLDLVLTLHVESPEVKAGVEERIRRALVKRLVGGPPPGEEVPVEEQPATKTTRTTV